VDFVACKDKLMQEGRFTSRQQYFMTHNAALRVTNGN